MAEDSLLVFTTVGDSTAARHLADALVGARAAACVNILPPVTSVFRWEPDTVDTAAAEVQAEAEVMLLMKTTTAAYPRLQQVLQAEHPYELPEIVAVPVTRGLPEFLQWIDSATRE
jgi:periplasmic divalent cation tolerance protein